MRTRMTIVFLIAMLSTTASAAEQTNQEGVQYPSRVAGQLSNSDSTQYSDWQCSDQKTQIYCAVASTVISNQCQIKSAASLMTLAWSTEENAWKTFPLFHEHCNHHITWTLKRLGPDEWHIQLTETAPKNESSGCLEIKAGTTTLDPVDTGHVYSCRPSSAQ